MEQVRVCIRAVVGGLPGEDASARPQGARGAVRVGQHGMKAGGERFGSAVGYQPAAGGLEPWHFTLSGENAWRAACD
jgi:hypothetical protein